MHFLTQPWTLTLIAGLLLILGAVAGWRLRKADVDAAAVTLTRMLHAEVENLTKALEQKTLECEHATKQAADEARRRVEVVETIGLIERDRDGWKERYWAAGLGHSAAQDMMMRQIMKLRGILRHHKLKIPRDSEDCDRTVNEYRATHVAQNAPKNSPGIQTGVDVASSHTGGVESAPKC